MTINKSSKFFFATAFFAAFVLTAGLTNATVYAVPASSDSAVELKPGDSILVNSHKIVLKQIAVDAASGAPQAWFDVYDSQGNKLQTLALSPSSSAQCSASTKASSEFKIQSFTVKIDDITASGSNDSSSSGFGQAKMILSTPEPVAEKKARSESVAVTPAAVAHSESGSVISKSVDSVVNQKQQGMDNANAQVNALTAKPVEQEFTESASEKENKKQIVLVLRKGWNMVSNPLAVGALFKTNCEAAKIWRYDAAAKRYDSLGALGSAVLEPGAGYWIYSNGECTISFEGSEYRLNGVALHAGWNQIGSASEAISASEALANCVVTSGPWGFDAATQRYFKASILQPGKAYFVRVAEACRLS
ncbi:MAG: hypothetical protein QW343_03410 [Candidatus Norongarragalinales archaeon]